MRATCGRPPDVWTGCEILIMRFFTITIALVIIMALSACTTGGENNQANENASGNYPAAKPTPTAEPIITHTIEELGATIEAAGQFWEDWWHKQGAFSHTDGTSVFIPTDEHGSGISYAPLLPSSGFENLNDIRYHLSAFYTEWTVNSEIGVIFIERDGGLYFLDARAGFPRFDWTTATHRLIEQDDHRAVVETLVLHGYFALAPGSFVSLRFYMLNGRIENIEGGSIVHATLWQDEEPWNEFSMYHAGTIFNIAYATEFLLAAFEYAHEADYTVVRNARDRVQSEPWGDRIAIWASRPLFQLELMLIGHEVLGEELIFIPVSTHEKIDELRPGQVFVINNYVGLCLIPWSGVTFLDEYGERHYFRMQHDNSDSPNMFFMAPFYDRTDELPDDWVPWWDED